MKHRFSRQLQQELRLLARQRPPLVALASGFKSSVRCLDKIRAVLFDVYGTLLVSQTGDISVNQRVEQHNAANAHSELLLWLNQHYSLEDLVYQQIREQHAIAKRQGVNYPEVDIIKIWQLILARCLSKEQQKIWPLTLQVIAPLAMEYELLVNQAGLMPQLRSTFAVLKQAKLPLGIVSNAQFYTPLTLEGLCCASLAELGFDERLCSWSYEQSIGKPAVEIFKPPLLQLERLGIQADEVLFVGNDLKKDIAPAQQMGMQTVLFVGERRSLRYYPDANGQIRPNCYITSLDQLLQILQLQSTADKKIAGDQNN